MIRRFAIASLLAVLAGSLLTLAPVQLSAQDKKFQLTPQEQQILDLTNKARKENEAGSLKANPLLTKAARDHSANMAKQKKMDHELDGKSPFDRIKAVGYKYRAAGENVAFGEGPVPIEQIFEGWMKSEGHRKNILNPNFVEIGVGIAPIENQKYYTQVFGRPLN